ncbi:MAG: hypothetical protein QXJ51_03270 [Sulfolobales archaeon]
MNLNILIPYTGGEIISKVFSLLRLLMPDFGHRISRSLDRISLLATGSRCYRLSKIPK